MSIALERNNTGDNRIEGSGFVQKMGCTVPVYSSPEFASAHGDRQSDEDQSGESSLTSSSTSSIGRNSDESSSGGGDGRGGGGDFEEEVQSEYKGCPLDSLDALEEVLPVKRGISKFYSGKSKSFTALADAATCSTIKEVAKPEDAYTRKRKNLLASNNFFSKSHGNIHRISSSSGLSKKPINSRSSLTLAAATRHYESNSNSESSNSNSSSPILNRPPLPPQARRLSNNESSSPPKSQKFPSWRSFSLSDLQGAAAATASGAGLFVNE